jgi:hypothetical protein
MNTKAQCDLCSEDADYNLCQQHLDIMRFPDVSSTRDGEYPDDGVMVLWQEIDGEDDTVYIGGYDDEHNCWFTQDGQAYPYNVLWCNLPNLAEIYRQENAMRGKAAQP